MTRPVRFTEADVRRAVKAARSCGIDVTGLRIEADGAITINPMGAPEKTLSPLQQWERDQEKYARQR